MTKAQVTRGQTISFRIPSDTPDHLVKQLQRLKETERRNFSSKIAEFVLDGVSQTIEREQELISIPLPKKLTKAQRDWLKYEHSEALIGSILHHLISDPLRATALLASLNSPSRNLDDSLILEKEESMKQGKQEAAAGQVKEETVSNVLTYDLSDLEDDDDYLSELSLDQPMSEDEKNEAEADISEEIDPEDLLGDFLAAMNK